MAKNFITYHHLIKERNIEYELPHPLAKCLGINGAIGPSNKTAYRTLLWVHLKKNKGPEKVLDLTFLGY